MKNDTQGELRHETKPGGLATLEAIALAMGVLEGEYIQVALQSLFELKLQRTLLGRGQKLRPSERP